MVVGAKVCDPTEDLLWFVCGLYVGILTSSLITGNNHSLMDRATQPTTCTNQQIQTLFDALL